MISSRMIYDDRTESLSCFITAERDVRSAVFLPMPALRRADFSRAIRQETGRAQCVRNLHIGAGLEWQQWRSNGRVLEDPAGDKAMLERDRAFHVRAAMIDGASHRE